MPKPINLQDTFLHAARRERTPVTIHVTNGYKSTMPSCWGMTIL